MPNADHADAFRTLPLEPDLLIDLSGDAFPTNVSAWVDKPLTLAASGSHFGIILEGAAKLSCGSGEFSLTSGMYFCAPTEAVLDGGRGLVFSRLGFAGFFHIGGPVEPTGRLRYIDGCSDSLLIPPVRRGDPCLNLLRISPGISQTSHTHPSPRIGLVLSGAGQCRTDHETHPLTAGWVFVIPAGVRHSFRTGDDELRIVAYHPDSDFGPTDDDHPMLNQTIVDARHWGDSEL